MQYAVLISAASTMVYKDLVCDERYDRLGDAYEAGFRSTQHGLEFEVMHLVDGTWLSQSGETATEVIRRRWTA